MYKYTMDVNSETVWFPVNWDSKRDKCLKTAAAEILGWLDSQKIYYEWRGKGRVIDGTFKVAIRFPKSSDAALAKLTFG